jgi:hypothetical protein
MDENKFILTSSNQDYTFICYEFEGKKIKPTFYKERIDELGLFPQNVPGRAQFFPFGIAKNDEYIYVISHTKLARFDANTYEYLGIVEECKTGVNSHQILFDEDDLDVLYICNTSNDSLTIFNFKTKENKYVLLKDTIDDPFEIVDKIDFKFDVYTDDKYHFNSICQHGDSLFLLFCYKGNTPAKIVEISKKDYQPLNIIEDVGFFNHDIIATDEYLYTLSTQTGELVEYNRKDKTINRHKACIDAEFWWIRGMKKINNSIYFFIGENWKKFKTLPLIVVREFDLETKNIVSTNLIPLKASTYQII